MVEVAPRISNHPEPFHDTPRTLVVTHRERHDFAKLEFLKAVPYGSPSTFGRVAVVPDARMKSPTDFDAGCEVRLESWDGKANETAERCHARHFDRPKAEAMLNKMPTDSFSHRVTLGTRQRAGKILRDLGIGIDCRERFQIALAPLAQYQPLRS
jgi:hypothetical protein